MRTLEQIQEELGHLQDMDAGLTGGLAEVSHPSARHFWSAALVLMQLAAVRSQAQALRWILGEDDFLHPLGLEAFMRAQEYEMGSGADQQSREKGERS